MKLYYSPGACSLSPHIVLREAGLPFELARVDLRTKTTAGGADFRTINPKGYVPALALDDGEVLTEGPAIVQYITDRVPDRKLAPAPGTPARYRLVEWLNFIATELHKGYSPLFNPKAPDDWKALSRGLLEQRLDWMAEQLAGRSFLLGTDFSVADAYLFTVLGWGKWVGIDLARWPTLAAYSAGIAGREAVRAALAAEKLVKE